jgi:excisionase family DNA binding protein
MDKVRLYRLPTVAQILGVGVRQVQKLVAEGKLVGIRFSERNWRVTQQALDDYLAKLRDL